ncbi:Uu.00g038380.m01.CDS01 [Anthostomella pinea]|uniref:Uu.00g038380.m01.CDS01 n=1 Tax=Anthostomella pinea TaxID=933095 RepID=A0AAI8YDQ5_9PEZI|nr:Uu.00g038380.m01.CDS01 [Anthostomella pinea]
MGNTTETTTGNGSSSSRHVVNVGVLIPTECQVLDAACVDVIGSMSHEYFSRIPQLVPQAVIDVAPSVRIHYIGGVAAGQPISMTANQHIVATDHFADAAVAPGKLDVVIVPGPDPFGDAFPADAVEWLRRQGEVEGVDVLSVCTGIFLCGEAGLLRGRTVCGTRGFGDVIRGRGFGEKELVGNKVRWMQDGNFWSSGGVTNGNDLVAAYCRASPKHFPRPLVEIACEMLDVGDRDREYSKDLMQPKDIEAMMMAVVA